MELRFDDSWITTEADLAAQRWNACANLPMPKAPLYGAAEHARREAAYDRSLDAVERDIKRVPRNKAERLTVQDRLVASFGCFAAAALDLEEEAVELITNDFLPVGTHLARWARRFDASLSRADIVQACRNAWTACGLQPLLGEPIGITPSILGYSLLYPYTDNYLDDEGIPSARKLEFSMRFRDRLCGLRIESRNRQEAAVWSMVRLIEDQFSRQTYPQVYECLLAIHQAQEDSLAQLDQTGSKIHDLLRLSFAKGGTSVLADACLSHGALNDAQARFAFHWGVLLQLGDDLQDLEEDLKNRSATLFSRTARRQIALDGLVLQLLAFSNRVADQVDQLPDGDRALKRMLRESWRSLILMAVARSHRFFSPEFLAELEPSSPFRFAFQRDRHKRLSGRRGLYKVLFDSFLASDAGLPDLPCPERWRDFGMRPGQEEKRVMAGSSS